MSKANPGPVQGECLCGGIRYEVDRIGSRMAHCHCSMCRKFHGAAYATFGEAKREAFRWLQGEALLKHYRAPNGTLRSFCGRCGSSLTFAPTNDNGELVQFTLGTLIDPPMLSPDAHIYVGSKAGWDRITDHLPCYEAGRDTPRID
ncbi:MAG: GFA family protein [Sedimenticola sp.]|nr:GFA family protein [Sedimenticola sp.]